MMDQQDRRPTAPFVSRATQRRFRPRPGFKMLLTWVLAVTLATTPIAAQTAIRIDEPPVTRGSWLMKNYQPRTVPPINLANTSRLDGLLKAGNLYLTSQDVVALVLENNIDIEVQRYGPLLAREVLRRAQGGGLLRSVGQGVAAGPTSVSLAGVSINTNGAPLSLRRGRQFQRSHPARALHSVL